VAIGCYRSSLLTEPSGASVFTFDVSIVLVPLNNCSHWPPFEKPADWTAQVLAFLKGY